MYPRMVALSLSLALSPLAAFAAPNFDRSDALVDPVVVASVERLRHDPELSRLGTIAHVDERWGMPTFVRSNPSSPPAAGTSPEGAARAHLAALAPLYGHDAGDAGAAPLRYVHDTGRGGIIVAFTQRVGGIEVYRDKLSVLMDRSLRPVAVSGFIPSRAMQVRGGFRLKASAAVERAIADFGGAALLTPGREPRTKKVLFHLGSTLVPGWYIELMGASQAYCYVYSAEDGELLFRCSQISSDVFTYRAWADGSAPYRPYDHPYGTAITPDPYGWPQAYWPSFVESPLVSLPNVPFSRNDPWLPVGATQSTGNNVDAYADLAWPDGFSAGDSRATVTSPGVFDHVYDPWQAPDASTEQTQASITQLFYDINWLHDWFYDSGFDEVSGNAQMDNYGRGGEDGDPFIAEAQDFDTSDNGTMASTSDGAPPRMAHGIWHPARIGIVVHSPFFKAEIAGTASFGPQNFGYFHELFRAPDNCCSGPGAYSPNIWLIDRTPSCSPATQVLNAQFGGATGVVLVDNDPTSLWPTNASGSDPSIFIPVLTVTATFGNYLKSALDAGPISITMDRKAETPRDGALDFPVVAHEWGHLMANRLVNGGFSTNMASGLNEGWGDFTGLFTIVRAEDPSIGPDFTGTYGVGQYALSSLYTYQYYFGIRRYPYCIDMSRNPLTFGHIADGAALPSGIPVSIITSDNSEVHNTGEVWCSMLWECYAALLRDTGRLTFDQAQLRMRDYLVASQKITPTDPTFTEARDAVLAVAAANDAADYVLFWQAFARRGIGMGAVSPPRTASDNSPVVESYVAGGDLKFVSLALSDITCDQDGYLDEGETGILTITVRNTGAINLSSTTGTVSSTNPAITFPGGTSLSFSSSVPLGLATATIPVGLQGSTALAVANFQVSFGDPAQSTPQPQTGSASFYVRADQSASATETFEAMQLAWPNHSTVAGSPWQRLELTPTSHALFGPDPAVLADQSVESPNLNVAAAGSFSFSFTHKFSFERALSTRYDGGVIEITNDGGTTWRDVNQFGAAPGYNGTITTSTSNPLGGRQAFTGTNSGYPATVVSTVNLGTNFAGQTVRVRFRIGTDSGGSAPGWQIDNVAFSNLTNMPFVSIVTDPDVCTATAVGGDEPQELAFAIEGAMPTRGHVHMHFALPEAGEVEVAIFDVNGRRAETLARGRYAAGRHSLAWSPGGASKSGVYFARMTAGGRTIVRRIIALR